MLATAQDRANVLELRSTYREAAEAISQRDYATAIERLEVLSKCSDDSLARVAQLHLCELFAANQRPLDALRQIEFLLNMPAAVGRTGSDSAVAAAGRTSAADLDSNRQQKLAQLYFDLAVRSGRVEQERQLGQLLEFLYCAERPSKELLGLASRSALRLSGLQMQRDEFSAARQTLQEGLKFSLCPDVQHQLNVTWPVLVGQRAFQQADYAQTVVYLTPLAVKARGDSVYPTVQFLLLESQLRLGATAKALLHADELERLLRSAPELPGWEPTLRLRQVEIAFAQRDHDRFEALLADAKTRFQDLPFAYEFNFLEARSHIAASRLDQARGTLNGMVQDLVPGSEPFARGHWMLGELSLMQQDTAAAMRHYQIASQQTLQPAWQSCALKQLARCYQHQGDDQIAESLSRQAAAIDGADSVSPERVAAIPHAPFITK